ncbi:hypothetical protein HK405_011559, partial [Cladochytrium tenue]
MNDDGGQPATAASATAAAAAATGQGIVGLRGVPRARYGAASAAAAINPSFLRSTTAQL